MQKLQGEMLMPYDQIFSAEADDKKTVEDNCKDFTRK